MRILVCAGAGGGAVEDSDDEVYFVDGAYWVHRGPKWYRRFKHGKSVEKVKFKKGNRRGRD